jgi:hypothetical protein
MPLPIQASSFTELKRGFSCWRNVFVLRGKLGIMVPRGARGALVAKPLKDFMELDGHLMRMKVLSDAELAELKAHPPPSVPSAILHSEWPIARAIVTGEDEDVYLSHFGHFVEAVASALLLEATDELPMPHVVLCCGCGPKFNGERGLNMMITAALYNDAPLVRCKEINGTAGVGIEPMPLQKNAVPDGEGVPPAARRPWALHMERVCIVDRHIAHRDKRTSVANNINTLLMDEASDAVQARMDDALARLRASPHLTPTLRVLPPSLEDFFGRPIGPTLVEKRAPGEPLVTIIYRKPPQRRSLEPLSFTELAAGIEELTPNVLVIQAELLTAPQQLAVFSQTDIMVSTQGNGMAHLLWQPLGSAVMEMFPHFRYQMDQGGFNVRAPPPPPICTLAPSPRLSPFDTPFPFHAGGHGMDQRLAFSHAPQGLQLPLGGRKDGRCEPRAPQHLRPGAPAAPQRPRGVR